MLFTVLNCTFSNYDRNDEIFMPAPLPLETASLLHLIFQCLVLFLSFPTEQIFFVFALEILPYMNRFCFQGVLTDTQPKWIFSSFHYSFLSVVFETIKKISQSDSSLTSYSVKLFAKREMEYLSCCQKCFLSYTLFDSQLLSRLRGNTYVFDTDDVILLRWMVYLAFQQAGKPKIEL